MTLSLAHQAVRAVVVAGGFMITADAVAAPRSVAEFTLQRQESQPKWIPEGKPLFGDYLGSGDGSGSGALVGRIDWDLYEDQSRDDRHPAWFRGFLERNGHRFPFEIIGVYTPDSADRRRWRLSGAISFDDSHLLGTLHAPITGTFEGSTKRAHYTIWADPESQ
jgi:hypothetical protein